VARTSLLLGFSGLLGFCGLALGQPSPTPAPTQPAVDFRFAHPDADLKMSLNVQALLNSPGVVKAIEQAKSQAQDKAMQIQMAMAMLKTVDRVSLSVRQKPSNNKASSNNASGNNAAIGPAGDTDVLVQVNGGFDSQMIAGLFPSAGSSKVKVVGPHTLLIGDGDSFVLAAERIAAAAPAPTDNFNDKMQQSDVWVSANYAFLAQKAGGTAQPLLPAFQKVRDISVGINLGEAPEINMLLTDADAAGASELLQTLQGMLTPLAQMAPAAVGTANLPSITQDGARLRLHFVVPPELLAMGQQYAQQYAQQQPSSGGLPAQLMPLLGSLGLGGAAQATKPAPPPPPANGGKIMIYGLDGGTVTLPGPK
jgi:hypothetical protein